MTKIQGPQNLDFSLLPIRSGKLKSAGREMKKGAEPS